MSFKQHKCAVVVVSLLVLWLFASSPVLAQTTEYFVPQVVDGGLGYRTLFTVTNLSASTIAQFYIQVTLDSGSPAAILTVPGQGSPQSNATITVQPGGQVTLTTYGGSSLSVGWADITSSSSIGVSAVFMVVDGTGNVTSAAGILPQPSQTTTTLVGLIKPFAKTGLAVLNPSSSAAAHLTFQLFNTTGNQVSTTKALTINPRGKIAQFFDEGQLFVGVTDFDGSVSITSDIPVQILSLRLDFPSNNLTTLPSFPGRTGTPLQHADATYAWIDATLGAGGSRVPLAGTNTDPNVDGQITTVAFPFPITFYGHTYGNTPFDQISVTEDGWISFGSAFTASPLPLPSASLPPALVAPFFVNFHFNADDTSVGVFNRVVGTAPTRQFVIQWNNVSFVNSALGSATFEIVFYEGTSDIKFQYLTVGNDINGAIAGGLVVGIQDDTRTQAVPINLGVTANQPRPNKAYTFQFYGGSNYTLVQN
jgi:hypothetical protein